MLPPDDVTPPAPPSPPSPPASAAAVRASLFEGTKSVSLAGLLLIYLTAVILGIICYLLITRQAREWDDYLPEVILFVVGCFSAFLGVGLVRTAGLSATVPQPSINPREWDVISDEVKAGKEEAITQYIRLTSLTGLTGFFTKLGLQGLPLATIGLTLFFSLLFLAEKEYLDLAKLTLGAFIGSFVQKQIGAAQSGGTVQLPTGERVRVSPSAPPTSI